MHRFGRLIEVSLLTFLKDEDAHGYKLREELISHGITDENINIGIVYRHLRSLEDNKLVKSIWEESEQGPKKRIYEITDEGKESLVEMIEMLKDRKSRIETIISLNS